MKPIPPMITTIFPAFAATLVACHPALISDLLMVTISLALLIVLVATEPNPGAPYFPLNRADQPPQARIATIRRNDRPVSAIIGARNGGHQVYRLTVLPRVQVSLAANRTAI
jgi:hypothetical protein